VSSSPPTPSPANVPRDRPVLLYAGSCPKCRWLSQAVVVASAGTVLRVPMEKPEWEKFYYQDFPQARGHPVLFVEGEPIFGSAVFRAVPVVVARTWVNKIHRLLRPSAALSGAQGASAQSGTAQSGSAQSGTAQGGSAQSGSAQSGSASGLQGRAGQVH
jgi:hypothetical protein